MAKKAVKINLPTGKPSRLLPIGCQLVCANTSVKKVKVFAVKGIQGSKRRTLSGGVGSIVGVTVKKGPEDMKHKMMSALVIRQKYPYTRFNHGKICFEDNAVVLLDEKNAIRKGVIRGVVAREVISNPKYAEIGAKLA